MKDLIFKLRVLRWMLAGTFDQWKAEVWRCDLDASYCCDGRECGCQASSNREMWGWHIKPGDTITIAMRKPWWFQFRKRREWKALQGSYTVASVSHSKIKL